MADALQRFVAAQEGAIDTALQELRAGRKRSHWMWFVFPQLRGLGHSSTAQFYGIASLDEARAYLAHPLLGARLRDCTEAVLASGGGSLHAIFGSPDDLKFRSCMTLFAHAAAESGAPDAGAADAGAPFRRALDRFCAGQEDARTQALLAAAPGPR